MSEQHARTLVSSLGATLGIDDLALDDRGYCCLTFDTVVLNIEHDAEQQEFLFYADVAAFDAGTDAQALADILEANHFAMLTGAGSLGLDGRARRLQLSARLLVPGLTARMLEGRITAFIERAEAWQRHLGISSVEMPVAELSGGEMIRI